jgi:hypothetical protein
MYYNKAWLSDFPLKDIMWLPGSHDAGMSTLTYNTPGTASNDNTLTQKMSIKDQLACGIRWFDIRPMRNNNGGWFCGHFDYLPITLNDGVQPWVGGTGQGIGEVMDQVCQFVRENSELVVLRMTHVHSVEDGHHISDKNLQKELLNWLYSTYPEVYRPAAGIGEEDCLQKKLSDFVGDEQKGRVIITNTPSDGPGFENDCFPFGRTTWTYGSNVGMGIEQAKLDAALKSGIAKWIVDILSRSSGPGFLISLFAKGESIIETSKKYQAAEAVYQPQRIASEANNGVISSDAIDGDFTLTLSLAATRARWVAMKFGDDPLLKNQLVVVYGGKLITDETILGRVRDYMETFQDMPVSKSILGDPWEGAFKTCVVYYRFEKRGSRMFYRGRWQHAGEDPKDPKLSFNIDIDIIQWDSQVLENLEFAKGYYNIFRGLWAQDTYRPVNEHFNNLKPREGNDKALWITYRAGDHAKSVLKKRVMYETDWENLGIEIDYIIWDKDWDPNVNKFLEHPGGYQGFYYWFGRKSRMIDQVWNSLFWDGPAETAPDPAPGKHKKCRMRWKAGRDESWEETESEEGHQWELPLALDRKIMKNPEEYYPMYYE